MRYDQFGQMGSIFSLGGAKILPPKGTCIVAVQFLADNIMLDLKQVDKVDTQYECIGDGYVAHDGAVTTQAITAANQTGNMLTLSGANAAIKNGMVVTSASGVILPDTKVLKYDSAGPTITLSQPTPQVAAGNVLTFHEYLGSGMGGETTNAAVFPKGMTIYGFWKEVKCTADANGGIIAYIGALPYAGRRA